MLIFRSKLIKVCSFNFFSYFESDFQVNPLKRILGEVGMSNELDDVARALFNGQIPQIWRALAPDTLKNLANWMAHFRQRNDQYVSWVNDGEPNCTWLSGVGSNHDNFIFFHSTSNFKNSHLGLHIPESYLTALVQSTCRKNQWALDRSTLYTQVTKFEKPSEITERPMHGAYIYGLYLEGIFF